MSSLMEGLELQHVFTRNGVTSAGTAERIATTAGVRTGRFINVKAKPANTGIVSLGLASTVILDTGWILSAGQETGWFPLPDGDAYALYFDSTAGTDDICVMIFGAPR